MTTLDQLAQAAQVKATVAQLYAATGSAHEQLLGAWQGAMDLVWQSSAGAEAIIAEMGTAAAGILALHARTTAFLEENVPGCTISRAQLFRPYTVNPDGTVTLVA